MSIENPDITVVSKKKKIKEDTGKSYHPAAFEKTEITPGPEPTADTVLHRQENIEPSPEISRSSISPTDSLSKTELSELLESLGGEEKKEADALLISIKQESGGKPKPGPFLEKEVSPEAKQERFLEDLIMELNQFAPKPIDRDDLDNAISGGNEDIHQRIRHILKETKADKIADLQKRSDIFELIFDFLQANFKKEKREMLAAAAEMDADNFEKHTAASEGEKRLKEKYNFEELKNKYAGLDLQMTDAEKKELFRLMEKNRLAMLLEKDKLSKEEQERMAELGTKSDVIKTWEEI